MKRVLIVIALLAACSKPEAPVEAKKSAPLPAPPTVAQAQDLIANAPEFGDYKFTNAAFTIAQKKSVMTPPMINGAKKLAAAKVIRFDGDDVVVLKPEDRRILVRPNGFIDIVPLAKKEMIGVTSVKQQADGTVLAEFTWKWVPNELGTAIGQPPAGDQTATAKLMHDGTSWIVLSIT